MLCSGHLSVSGGHNIYYETYGKRDGRPAVVLHGGPGGGSNPKMADIYDLKKWFVVLFDQRGCGKSTPYLCLKNNTTCDLIKECIEDSPLNKLKNLKTHAGSQN
jgi:proline iminopeptidase